MGHDAPVTPNPLKFDAAISAFRDRVPLTRDEWNQLDDEEHDFAFTVSGVSQANLVTQVWDAVDSAVEDGETLGDFKDRVAGMLYDQWGSEDGSRVETIFRTNVNQAYNDGREAVFRDPEVMADRPIWRYELIDDDALCPICAECDGVILPADDGWWDDHRPILHMSCFPGYVRVTTSEGARPIQNVEPGDMVLSHDGSFHRVITRSRTPHRDPLLRIRAGHQVLDVTANHPLAGEERWIRADRLDVQRDQVWVLEGGRPVAKDPPSKCRHRRFISSIVHRLKRGAVPLSAVKLYEKLHRRDAKIGVEDLDRQLRNMVDASHRESRAHRALVSTAKASLSRSRAFRFLLDGLNATASRFVRGLHLQLALAHAHGAIPARVVLRDRANYAGLREQLIHRRPAAPVLLGQGDRGLPREVERDDFVLRERNRLLSHGLKLSNIDIEGIKYSGSVYNLEVEGARTFFANGVLVHNCRCSFTALTPEEAREEGYESDDDGPDVEADDGFGGERDWDPDGSDYPAEIGAVFSDRMED